MNGWWLWVALVGAAPAAVRTRWTLQDLFHLAMERNEALLAREVSVRAEAWRRLPAGSLPSPMVGYMWDPTDAPWNRQGWVMSQTVPFPMKLWERVRLQDRRVAQAEAVEALVRARLLRDVEMACHDLVYALAWDSLIQDYREVLLGAQRVSTSRYRTGLRPLKEPVRWQLERARLDAERAAVRALIQDARLRLTALLRLSEPLDPAQVVPPETLEQVRGALQSAPLFQQGLARQQTAEVMARLNSGPCSRMCGCRPSPWNAWAWSCGEPC
ncbi:MAG: hypothetical protein L3J76_02875 [Candidatus Hydrothermae bacterium]|nr:hypothetical protein [Candidatus Hydrothermae bacterium]